MFGAFYSRAVSAIARHAMQFGLVEDEAFSVLTGGQANQTFSVREALGQRAGQPAACWVCWNLNWIVQPHHCALALAGGSIPWPNAIRAFLAISFVLFGLPALAWQFPARTAIGVAVALAVDVAAYHFTRARKEAR